MDLTELFSKKQWGLIAARLEGLDSRRGALAETLRMIQELLTKGTTPEDIMKGISEIRHELEGER